MGPICWEYTEAFLEREPGNPHGYDEDNDGSSTGHANRLGAEGWELVGASAPGEGRQGLFKRPYRPCPKCGNNVVFTYASGGGFQYAPYSERHLQECQSFTTKAGATNRYCYQNVSDALSLIRQRHTVAE